MGDISSVLKMTRIIVIRTPIYLLRHSSCEQTPSIVYFNSESCHEEINTADFALNREAKCKLYIFTTKRPEFTYISSVHHITDGRSLFIALTD